MSSQEQSNKTVVVPESTYMFLVEQNLILRQLRAYGVDNWEGYDEAMRNYHESTNEKDN